MSKIVEIALALTVVYLMMSTLVSALNEWLSAIIFSRSRSLREAVNMLTGAKDGKLTISRKKADGTVDKVAVPIVDMILDHNMSRSQATPTWLDWFRKNDRSVNRIPADLLPTILIDAVSPFGQSAGPRDFGEIWSSLLEISDTPLGHSLLLLAEGSNKDLEAFKVRIRNWWIETLDANSGAYKRRTQRSLLIISAIAVFGLNIDTIRLSESLWVSDTMRTGMAEYARQIGDEAAKNKTTAPKTGESEPVRKAGTEPTAAEIEKKRQDALADFDRLEQMRKKFDLPIFWKNDETPLWLTGSDGQQTLDFNRALWKVLGLCISAVAVSMGAPFYFDLLQKVSNVRLTGNLGTSAAPQGSAKATDDTPAGPEVA
jgi:hypothetical protein